MRVWAVAWRSSTCASATGSAAAALGAPVGLDRPLEHPGELAKLAEHDHSSARSASVTPGTRRLTSSAVSNCSAASTLA